MAGIGLRAVRLGKLQSYRHALSSRCRVAVAPLCKRSCHAHSTTTEPELESTIHGPVVISPYRDLRISTKQPLHQRLIDFMGKHSKETALIDVNTEKTVNFGDLQSQVIKIGSSLSKMGFQKGDVMSILAPNCIEYPSIYLGIAAMGGVSSPLNPVFTKGEILHAVELTKSKLIFTTPELVETAKIVKAKCPSVKEIIVIGKAEGCRPLSKLLESSVEIFPDNLEFNMKEDLFVLPLSSGTTGLPKAVMLSHYNVSANLDQITTEETFDYHEGDTFFGMLPYSHVHGQTTNMLAAMKLGAKCVVFPKFEPNQFLQAVEKYRPTYLHVTPPIMLFLAKHPAVKKTDWSSVRNILVETAPISHDVVDEVTEKTGIRNIRQAFGMTEASPVTHTNPPDNIKYHAIGHCVHNTESKIVDLKTGAALGPGEVGELCVRGPQVMKGYLNNPEETAQTVQDGWLHTGDLAKYDNEGYFYITDRMKELIKCKGFQVAPAELEALLNSHHAIQESAVIGIPHEKSGEVPRAYVVRKPNRIVTKDEVKRHVEDNMAHFKHLAGGVEFRDAIPKSSTGKILRRKLKSQYLEKYVSDVELM